MQVSEAAQAGRRPGSDRRRSAPLPGPSFRAGRGRQGAGAVLGLRRVGRDELARLQWPHERELLSLGLRRRDRCAVCRYIGVDDDPARAASPSTRSRATSTIMREVGGGEPLKYTTQLLDCDSKRLHIFNWMHHGRTGDLLATTEQMLVHVDMKAGRSSSMPPEVKKAADAVMAAHKACRVPDGVGQRSPSSASGRCDGFRLSPRAADARRQRRAPSSRRS